MENTKLIELKDGTFVEIRSGKDEYEQISSRTAKKVEKGLNAMKPLFQKSIDSVVRSVTWQAEGVHLSQIEIEMGLGFEGEGNIYIARGKGTVNLNVKFTIKPTPPPSV